MPIRSPLVTLPRLHLVRRAEGVTTPNVSQDSLGEGSVTTWREDLGGVITDG